ncbi:MAG: DUF835 domain-containing protein [Thermoplasmata archaeon]
MQEGLGEESMGTIYNDISIEDVISSHKGSFSLLCHGVKDKNDMLRTITSIAHDKKNIFLITRTHPSILSELVKYSISNVYWLSEKGDDEDIIKPTETTIMHMKIEEFMGKYNESALIILDNLEYMMFYNGFEKVFKLIGNISDDSYIYGSLFISFLDERAFNEKEKSLLDSIITLLNPKHYPLNSSTYG